MKKEKKTKPYVEPYFEEMHRKGIILTIISLILFVGVPTITCIVYDIMPNFGTVIATGIGLIAIFVPTGIAEMFGEVPIMGSSYYLACLTGNILNLKLPSAINAIKVSGFKQGTKEADVVVGIAIAVSSLVTLVILALGVILLMPLESFMTSEAIGIAASNVLPALFGCLVLGFIGNDVGGGIIIKGRLKAAIVPFIFFIVLYLLISDLYEAFEGFLMIIGIGMVYLITKKMYKAGKIEVILPESDSMEAADEIFEAELADPFCAAVCYGGGDAARGHRLRGSSAQLQPDHPEGGPFAGAH